MLYTNTNLKVQEIEKDWGVLRTVNVGECGRGRREMRLPTNIKEERINKGSHGDLSIGLTRNGGHKIIHTNKDIDKLYMILSSEGGYTRRGDGYICIPSDRDDIKVLDIGNGADGDAGRIGQWQVGLLEVPMNRDVIIRVRHSGADKIDEFVFLHEGDVYTVEGMDDLRDLCDNFDIDMPFTEEDKIWKIIRR